MPSKYLILLLFVLSVAPHLGKAALGKSFGEAKAKNRLVYQGIDRTFYCDCAFQKRSIKAPCPLALTKYIKRARRLEWEHVVPAHAFGQSFPEWRNAKNLCVRKNKKKLSSRKCARKHSDKFRLMEADLHNIVPVVGAVNAVRSNYSFAEISDEKASICSAGFRLLKRKVMPPPNRKGDVARIYQYMNNTYPGHGIISNKNEKLFDSWAKLDPVDSYECRVYLTKKKYGANLISELEKACNEKVRIK